MSEHRLNKLEESMTNLNNSFSEFLVRDAARQEREKSQCALNETMRTFIADYIENDKPVIKRSKKAQAWLDYLVGRMILPIVVFAILSTAGVVIYNNAGYSVEKITSESSK